LRQRAIKGLKIAERKVRGFIFPAIFTPRQQENAILLQRVEAFNNNNNKTRSPRGRRNQLARNHTRKVLLTANTNCLEIKIKIVRCKLIFKFY